MLYPPFSSTILETGRDVAKTPQDNLVVTVSRLDTNKLLERIPRIAAQTDKNTQFAVIGRLCNERIFNYLQILTKKLGVSDRVRFYPNAPLQQKIELLKKAKIYLHTMEGEHFGISIVEAMAMGCLPIAHDSGGMKEFVPPQYRYETVEEAASKISTELNGWSRQKADEVKAIAGKFSISNFSRRFMELYSKYYN